ncbi:MAG: class I SAM-dependent methyltransferase [Pseudomonadota bacterium]
MTIEARTIEWSLYAEHYDAMCSANPSYQEMISLVETAVGKLDLPAYPRILDIGAGTGNLLYRLCRSMPTAKFVHLDQDPVMVQGAVEKYKEAGLEKRIEVVAADFLDYKVAEGSFDLILSTNAIYAMHPHEEVLDKVFRMLKEGSHFCVVDFGRKQNTADWALYLAISNLKTQGVQKTVKIFMENWEVARQNRKTTTAQEDGEYWLHSDADFVRALKEAGFVVQHSQPCYRNYSDFAMCLKP